MPLSQRRLHELNRTTQDDYTNRNGRNGQGRQDNVWVVQGGDSLAKIAREVYGNERMMAEIIRLNGGGLQTIRPGMVLRLPQAKDNRDIYISPEWGANMGMATPDQLREFYANNPNSNATYAFNQAGYGWKNSKARGGPGIEGLGVPGSDGTGTLPAGPLGAPAPVKTPFSNSNAAAPFQTPYGMQNLLPTPPSLSHSGTPFGVPPGQPPVANSYGDRYDRNAAPAPQGAPKVIPRLTNQEPLPPGIDPAAYAKWQADNERIGAAARAAKTGNPYVDQANTMKNFYGNLFNAYNGTPPPPGSTITPQPGQPTTGQNGANSKTQWTPQQAFGMPANIPLVPTPSNSDPLTVSMIAPYVSQAIDRLVFSGNPKVTPTITLPDVNLLVQAGVLIKDSQDYKDAMSYVNKSSANPFDPFSLGLDTGATDTTTTDTTGTPTDIGNGKWDPMNLGYYGKMPVQMKGKGGHGGGGGGALAQYAGSVSSFGPSLGMHQWRGL